MQLSILLKLEGLKFISNFNKKIFVTDIRCNDRIGRDIVILGLLFKSNNFEMIKYILEKNFLSENK